jgi:hypothetical protein
MADSTWNPCAPPCLGYVILGSYCRALLDRTGEGARPHMDCGGLPYNSFLTLRINRTDNPQRAGSSCYSG